jgi:uncharacterized SAM-binding protein YcdF (DUF218 family)
MFFYAAKLVWFLLQPSTLLVLLLLAGLALLWTRWWRIGRALAVLAGSLLLFIGLSPLGNALILPLEERFPRADLRTGPPPTGFILLGGAEDRLVGTARKAPTLNEAGERVVETVMLARRFPEARIAFSGGSAGLLYKSDTEAAGAEQMLVAMGVEPERLVLEDESRDTYENAVLLKAKLEREGLLGPDTRWVMVTSAFHIPRAMGAFRQAGFDVEPWPVDYRTRGMADLSRPFDRISEGLRRVDTTMREWVGLFAYWITGRTDALFPAPAKRDLGCDHAGAGAAPDSPCRPSL